MFNSLAAPRILYMGTPEISSWVLSSLLEAGVNIVAVVTNPDKPKGRGDKVEFSPVKQVAHAHNLPVYQPAKIRDDHAFLKELDLDVILTMAYGQIVPEEVLKAPRFGCLNLHGSLLPKYRGAAPMQRSLIEGEDKTGVTLMEMVKAMDAGRMFAKIEIPLLEEDNYTSLSEKVAKASAELILTKMLDVINGINRGEEQDESEVTYAAKIDPNEEHLDLSLPTASFINYVRGLSLTPGGYLFLEDKKLKILSAKRVDVPYKGELGQIVSARKGVFVQGSNGILSLESVQLEGKKRMDGKSFANGMRDLEGKILR